MTRIQMVLTLPEDLERPRFFKMLDLWLSAKGITYEVDEGQPARRARAKAASVAKEPRGRRRTSNYGKQRERIIGHLFGLHKMNILQTEADIPRTGLGIALALGYVNQSSCHDALRKLIKGELVWETFHRHPENRRQVRCYHLTPKGLEVAHGL